MEGKIDRVDTGDLVLEIGDGIGALIIYTPAELRGAEIEVSMKGVESPRIHTVVQERLANFVAPIAWSSRGTDLAVA